MRFLVLFFSLAIVLPMYGQQAEKVSPKSKWKLDAVGFRLSTFVQYNVGLDYDQIKQVAKSPKDLDQFDMTGYEQIYRDPNTGNMGGVFIRVARDIRPGRSEQLELQVDHSSFSEIYTEYEAIGSRWDYIGWCLMNERLDVDIKYWREHRTGVAGFRFGPSLTLGKSYNDNVLILRPNASDVSVDARSNYFGVVHGNIQGFLVVGKLIEVNLGGRLGLGAQALETDLIASVGAHLGLALKL